MLNYTPEKVKLEEEGLILSAGVVLVREKNDGWCYLFLRAYRNWDFPKGVVEKGEDPIVTAVREVAEETGIRGLTFCWGPVYKETAPYLRGKKIARYYIAKTSMENITLPVSAELGRPEHDEYRWLSYEELQRCAPERLRPIVEWANTVVRGK